MVPDDTEMKRLRAEQARGDEEGGGEEGEGVRSLILCWVLRVPLLGRRGESNEPQAPAAYRRRHTRVV